jgi:hypothetical protein
VESVPNLFMISLEIVKNPEGQYTVEVLPGGRFLNAPCPGW